MTLTSTALSDGVLCLTTFAAAFVCWRGGKRGAALCLAIIAFAGLLGTLRFAGAAGVSMWHERLSRFAAIAALPTFCIVFWRAYAARRMPSLFVAIVLMALLFLLAWWMPWPPYPTGIGAVGLVLALWGSVASRRASVIVPGVIAVALYAVAGLVIGTSGSWHGWLRVDLYHYAIAIANPLFALALRPAPRG